MGFLKDQEGIITRYINEEGNWEAHLRHTKGFITDVVKKYKPESVSILGSGWLLDVPIEFLAANCKSICLYDIRHPAQIRHRLRRFKNVVFVECDLTGVTPYYRVDGSDITAVLLAAGGMGYPFNPTQ